MQGWCVSIGPDFCPADDSFCLKMPVFARNRCPEGIPDALLLPID